MTASTSGKHGQKYFTPQDKRPIILYDGVCNLCNGGVNTMLAYDRKGHFRLAALQSDAGKELLQRVGRDREDLSSIVLVTEDNFYIKSDAILRIGRQLDVPFWLLSTLLLPLPHFVRDTVYDQVAGNRYSIFGKSDSLRLSDEESASRFLN
ncbi:hypothetical protein WJX81_008631 [Elliptochloris bilobata]|uniref:Thiol-disulfide oxidoreductase DCC n=1 Tax=Elliptochloris bilobata TaxID=381761 RepID=A0AAW1SJ55_9CHLO